MDINQWTAKKFLIESDQFQGLKINLLFSSTISLAADLFIRGRQGLAILTATSCGKKFTAMFVSMKSDQAKLYSHLPMSKRTDAPPQKNRCYQKWFSLCQMPMSNILLDSNQEAKMCFR